MLRNKLYYAVKPFVPWSVRQRIRAWFASRKRERVAESWPILPSSERPPEGWPGWPGGKQFAFVLTHDVEGPLGVHRCRKLMELEMKLGFRSSFNFIPEGGQYTLGAKLREELTANGFEIGVHDLNHDGKLYDSHRGFSRKAARINHYLKEWGAVGFRSGFMLHNLEWLKELDVLYDASTFDTDPFEPQPDNAGTIFPFWAPRRVEGWGSRVEGRTPLSPLRTPRSDAPGPSLLAPPSSDGYVELPYTLPQDSTLFLLLGERQPDIWLHKLDWIARHGGMALVNVHPDYLRFDGEPISVRTYPVEFYARFLEYVRERYAACFWHALPKEVAAFAQRAFCTPGQGPRHRPEPTAKAAG